MTFELFRLGKMSEGRIKILKDMFKYMEKYKSFMHGHYVLDYPWVIEKLPKNLKGKKILDLGAGFGSLQFYLYEKGADVLSVDMIDYRKQVKPIKFKQIYFGDVRKLIPLKDNTFDYIVSVSSLEHNLPQLYSNSLFNCKSLLKKKGKLILTLPFDEKPKVMTNMLIMGLSEPKNIEKMIGLKLDTDFDNSKEFDEIKKEWDKKNPLGFIPGGIVFRKI